MSAQSPSGPSQPPKSEAFKAVRNTMERKISEQAVADTPGSSGPYGSGNDYLEYRKAPSGPPRPSISEGGPGIHGTDPRDYKAMGGHPLRQNENVDAEQMAPAGEGEVARAVEGREEGNVGSRRHGRTRGEVSLEGTEAHLERKRAQQSWAREEVKGARRKGKDVDGGAGASGRQPSQEV